VFDLPRSGRAVAVAFLAALLLAGCGGGGLPTGAGPTAPPAQPPAPQSVPRTAEEETTTPAPAGSAAELPWPAAGAAEAAALQAAADNGAQPWLLDPAEVALSYASAAHGWTDAEAQPGPDGIVEVRRPGGQRLALTVAQPGRTGRSGIWVVTTEHDR
jgi:hypothetical protein